MHSISLTVTDFQEILSSLLLSSMSYPQRLSLAKGGSLPASMGIDTETVSDLPVMVQHVCRMFHVPENQIIAEGKTLAEWAGEMHRLWCEAPTTMTFFTSGSTGEPTPATQDFSFHVQEVLAWAELLKGRKRIVSFVPRHHIYGFLFSILLPKAIGCPVLWMPIMPMRSLIAGLQGGDLVIAFPLFWDKLTELNIEFPGDVCGVTSTGPCRPEIIATLNNKGLAGMTEVYGSSETGGVGYRFAPLASYELLPFWERAAVDNQLVRQHPVTGSPAPYVLQDDLTWEENNTFLPVGRVDKAVQVAGVNVYPARVRKIILEHPLVADCVVRLMRPEEGPKLKALIVLKKGVPSEKAVDRDLSKLLDEKLNHYERPAKLAFCDQIPVNSLGKVQDW
jgi:4-coumarate--CoA ligase (photoactive yellow protein activation family)